MTDTEHRKTQAAQPEPVTSEQEALRVLSAFNRMLGLGADRITSQVMMTTQAVMDTRLWQGQREVTPAWFSSTVAWQALDDDLSTEITTYPALQNMVDAAALYREADARSADPRGSGFGREHSAKQMLLPWVTGLHSLMMQAIRDRLGDTCTLEELRAQRLEAPLPPAAPGLAVNPPATSRAGEESRS